MITKFFVTVTPADRSEYFFLQRLLNLLFFSLFWVLCCCDVCWSVSISSLIIEWPDCQWMRSVSILYILPSFCGTDHIFSFWSVLYLVISCFVTHLCLLDWMLHILLTFNWLASAVLSAYDVWNHLWWLLLQESGVCENLFLLHYWRFCILLGPHDLTYKMAVQCIMRFCFLVLLPSLVYLCCFRIFGTDKGYRKLKALKETWQLIKQNVRLGLFKRDVSLSKTLIFFCFASHKHLEFYS